MKKYVRNSRDISGQIVKPWPHKYGLFFVVWFGCWITDPSIRSAATSQVQAFSSWGFRLQLRIINVPSLGRFVVDKVCIKWYPWLG